MSALLPAWTCLLLGLLPLELHTRSLTHHTLGARDRSPKSSKYTTPSYAAVTPATSRVAPDDPVPLTKRGHLWRALLKAEPPPRLSQLLLHQDAPSSAREGSSRGRRHANSGGRRGQLMRVGCVLGTCQVQNLSHRLYQLIGQSGRDDSSPINPRSPHSYG
ncbi:protein ADM2 [Entelurus aequoreus]|uniref:protein ADM2 n=1 Tax=Entelurus aequoreus TaxID=161455 RepID=UPI002B1D1A97|nr:protein ADM2 [Entelurus aequoreus]